MSARRISEIKTIVHRVGLATALIVAAWVAVGDAPEGIAQETRDNRVYELRTYTTADGRLDALLARFAGGEVELFHKHGMESVGYWVPSDAPESDQTMVYMLAHASREQAAASWQAFLDDPEWQTMRSESLIDGPIVTKVESKFLDPTAFSPLR